MEGKWIKYANQREVMKEQIIIIYKRKMIVKRLISLVQLKLAIDNIHVIISDI